MSLSAFLSGTRPNPDPSPFALVHQHAEGGPWTVVATAESAEGLAEELAAGARDWPVDALPGDLVQRAGRLAFGEDTYGVDEQLALVLLPWPSFGVRPEAMAGLCFLIPRGAPSVNREP